MTSPTRPVPALTDSVQPEFWRAAADRTLLLRQCQECRAYLPTVQAHCHCCGSLSLAWTPASGRGEVYTYTVVRRHHDPYFRAKCPYVVAWIDLEEGSRILSEVTDVAPEDVYIGMPVRVAWDVAGDGAVPVFVPSAPKEVGDE